MKYDYLIRGGTIIDGSGGNAYVGDVGIREGKLSLSVSEGDTARRTIRAEGKWICPGFIDSHSHIDEFMTGDPGNYALCKISQGVTTEVVGQCGESLFPVTPDHLADVISLDYSGMPQELLDKLKDFSSFQAYLKYVDSIPKVQNYAFNCGHSTLRTAVMGLADRAPSAEELAQMKELLRECMKHGCTGMSTGLIYIPGTYAETEEIIELCRVVKEYDGVYCTHMRSESSHVLEAVREAVKIAAESGVRLVISHHKTAGRENFGLSKETLKIIDQARRGGCSIYLDQYPYTAAETNLNVLIPPQYFSDGMDHLEKQLQDSSFRERLKQEIERDRSFENYYINCGGFGNIMILSAPNVPEACGMTIQEYADRKGMHPMDAYLELITENHLGGLAAFFYMDEADVERIYSYDHTMAGSDCLIPLNGEPAHPRAFGTFIKTLDCFARQKGLVTLEEAVYKQTGLTARCWQLAGKGYIREGYDADLVILNPDTLKHTPSYQNANVLCEGIEQVFVNGEAVFENGKLTGAHTGTYLLRKQE